MCGRFTLSTPRAELSDLFPLFDVPDLAPRYNIAPTQPVAAARVAPDTGKREVTLLRWGLIPSWADDPKVGNGMINARAETAATKPAYRSAYKRRRCLIPSTGFYEWQKTDSKHKQPYFIHLQGDGPFSFAGLWEHWERDGNIIESCTILTTDANDLIRPLHDRMPVILRRDDYERWLDPTNTTGAGLADLLAPFPANLMAAFPVGKHVNNPRNENADCVVPLNT